MSRPSKPKPAAASSRSRAPVRKASARKRKGQTVRFDFDSHGAQSAFVAVQEEDTSDASDLIAAAIRQSWDDADLD